MHLYTFEDFKWHECHCISFKVRHNQSVHILIEDCFVSKATELVRPTFVEMP